MKAVAKVDVHVNKYGESLMNDGSSVCNAKADNYSEKDDGGTTICRFTGSERDHYDGPKSLGRLEFYEQLEESWSKQLESDDSAREVIIDNGSIYFAVTVVGCDHN